MKIPKQKYFVGDLVIMTKDHWPYLKAGQIGYIRHARCDEACSKGGIVGRDPDDGGPHYVMEWGYVGVFGHYPAVGVRLDGLSPAEVISEIR